MTALASTPGVDTTIAPAAHPWFKLYPASWQGDPLLASCSMAARGFLMEIVCLMHNATPYGHLLVNGIAPTDAELARLTRARGVAEAKRLRHELITRGVLSVTNDRILFSRRMVRTAAQSAAGRFFGKQGGNPALAPLTRPLTPRVKTQRIEDRRQRRSAHARAAVGPVFSGATFSLTPKQHAVITSYLGLRQRGVDLDDVYRRADDEWTRVGFQPDDLLRELKMRAKRAADARADLITGPDGWEATQAKIAEWTRSQESSRV